MSTSDAHSKPKEFKKSQIRFIRPAQMSLFAKIVSHPPLGQTTVLPGSQKSIPFTVVIESSSSFPEVPWEVSIWHGFNDPTNWSSLPLQKHDGPSLLLRAATSETYATTFHGTLSVEGNINQGGFTVRFRTHADAAWQWENQIHGIGDGTVIFQEEEGSSELSDVLDLTHSTLRVEPLRSQSPGATVSLVVSKESLPNVDDGDARTKLIKLGRIKDQHRFFALIRKWSPWLGPVHGTNRFHLTEDALLCSFLTSSGKHVVLLALNDLGEMLTLFKSDNEGNIVIAARNDGAEPSPARVVVSVADHFEIANAAAMYAARDFVLQSSSIPEVDISKEHLRTQSVDEDTVIVSKDFKAQWLEDWYDGLSYCTWNSLGQDLTEEKILDALQSLNSAGIKVTSLIIDDNWQSLDNPGANQFKRGWKEFEADSKAFPNGLKHTATTVRSRFPNIQHIAVWHALGGYWGWISPDGKIAKEYKTKTIHKDETVMPIETGATALAVDPDDIHRMYDDFYRFLSSSGIDSVKTDVQFALDILASTDDRRRFTDAYQDAWLIAINKHFAAKAISCMSQIPQIIFHSLLPKNRPTILFRNSDDFFPAIPESHPYHIFWNAHNSLLVQHLNVLPDWDMFQTSHPYAAFHAAARCISGGPIYITDSPGQHDVKLIAQLSARNPRGQTIILRPSTIGKTLDVYNNYNERHVLRVGCYNGPSRTGTGIIGLFNIDERERSCLVPLQDFPGVVPDQRYIIRSHVKCVTSSPMELTGETSPKTLAFVALPNRGYELLTAYPLYPVSGTDLEIAPLGLLGKMTGAAAIVSSTIGLTEDGNRARCRVAVKALGTVGIWISDLENRTVEDDFLILILGRVIPVHTVKKTGKVLEIDIETAWDEMGLSAGWSNEVRLELFVKVQKK